MRLLFGRRRRRHKWLFSCSLLFFVCRSHFCLDWPPPKKTERKILLNRIEPNWVNRDTIYGQTVVCISFFSPTWFFTHFWWISNQFIYVTKLKRNQQSVSTFNSIHTFFPFCATTWFFDFCSKEINQFRSNLVCSTGAKCVACEKSIVCRANIFSQIGQTLEHVCERICNRLTHFFCS